MTVVLADSLPQSAYTATQVLDNEEQVATLNGISLGELMARAGKAVFEHIQRHFPQTRSLCIIVGKGNNGGDGFVIARLALEQGWQVTILAYCNIAQLKGEAKAAHAQLDIENVRLVNALEQPVGNAFFHQTSFDCIVDCLFGIGFKGQLAGIYREIALLINDSDIPVVSVDTPSGLNATTGEQSVATVRATHTVTFIALKQGLLTGGGLACCGQIFYADLGLNSKFQQQVASNVHVQHQTILPCRQSRQINAHKGDIGLLLAIGGNRGMPGAIRLAGEAALRAGASLVGVHCHVSNHVMVIQGRPELMLAQADSSNMPDERILANAKAMVIGPGLGRDDWAKTRFEQVIEQNIPKVVDADALHFLALSERQAHNEHWVLTPHSGEAAKLLGVSRNAVECDRYSAVRNIAKKYGGVCVLKGAGSLISDGDAVWVNST